MLENIAHFCWFCCSMMIVIGFIAQIYKVKKGKTKARNVKFVIVSIANKNVRKALFNCIDETRKKFEDLSVLVDEGSELISELSGNDLIVVPKNYRKDLIGKGRSMNYFIENVVLKNYWYAFIDDDNIILDDNFLYEISYYEKKGYVAMNPLLVPRKGKSNFIFIMDFIRKFDDLFIYKFFTGLCKKPLVGLHGELLCVKGNILKEIGYNNKSLTEDFRFASEIVKRNYNVWQSSTKVSIQSPNNIRDFVKQRGRWFKGIACDLKYCRIDMQIVIGLKMLLWVFGICGSWMFAIFWLSWGSYNIGMIGGLYYLSVYSYGIFKSGKFSYFLFIPLFGIIEAISFAGGLKHKKFVVINKD